MNVEPGNGPGFQTEEGNAMSTDMALDTSDAFEAAMGVIADCIRTDFPGCPQFDVVIHTSSGEYVMSHFFGGRDV